MLGKIPDPFVWHPTFVVKNAKVDFWSEVGEGPTRDLLEIVIKASENSMRCPLAAAQEQLHLLLIGG